MVAAEGSRPSGFPPGLAMFVRGALAGWGVASGPPCHSEEWMVTADCYSMWKRGLGVWFVLIKQLLRTPAPAWSISWCCRRGCRGRAKPSEI